MAEETESAFTMKDFLDNKQYTKRSILRYEKIYGEGSVSTGGVEHAAKMINEMKLQNGCKVLDVGSGIGGQAFHMANLHGVSVKGIDFSKNMLEIARERLLGQSVEVQSKVEFQFCDVTNEELPEAEFDFLHCRDVMMHVSDKRLWIQKFFNTLKPGGKVAVSDYFRGEGANSSSFNEYVAERRYSLVSLNEFQKIFDDVGFVHIYCVNGSKDYGKVLERELAELETKKEAYVGHFSTDEYERMKDSWRNKLRRNVKGDHQWGYIIAAKPS